jgi:hypothetical protein
MKLTSTTTESNLAATHNLEYVSTMVALKKETTSSLSVVLFTVPKGCCCKDKKFTRFL